MWAAVGAVVVAGLGLFAVLAPSSSEPSLLQPEDSEIVALGREIYDAHCASCHGANFEGESDWQSPRPDGFMPAPPHDETGHTWHHPDDVLFDVTKNGLKAYAGESYRSRMPAFAGVLTDGEIIAALSYIKAQWPREKRDRHDKMNAARQETLRRREVRAQK